MRKTIFIALVLLALFQNAYTQAPVLGQEQITQIMQHQLKGFASLEHQALGDEIVLQFDTNNPEKLLHLPNGLTLTYSQIIMLGGDVFGDPEHPIANCTPQKHKTCFKLQFATLAAGADKKGCENPLTQANNVIQYHHVIEKSLIDWRNVGKTDSDFYQTYGSEINKKLNRLTCGGSFISDYFPLGVYLKLAEVNFDHFLPDSLIAYQAGHEVALKTAQKAYKQKSKGNSEKAEQLLELAYAQNAFANHYLSDSFASGHMRTPRRAIDKQVKLPAVLNLLIANLMHDEDNRLGLQVVNEEGISWFSYGDNYLFQKEAETQHRILLNAMQRSADAIYETFISGNLPEYFAELKLVPLYEKIEELNQTAPLFKLVDGVLLRRKEVANPYNFEWTSDWSGLAMLLKF